MAAFTEASVRDIEDFVLKCRHMRHELLDAELLSLEAKHGDVGAVFVSLKPTAGSSGLRLGDNSIESDFLKCVRDIPAGAAHFTSSPSFLAAFKKCSTSNQLQHIFLDLVATAHNACLGLEVCRPLIEDLAAWVGSEDELTAEGASKALERLCALHTRVCLPVLMRQAGKHSSDSVLMLRYAKIISRLLNIRPSGTRSSTSASAAAAPATVDFSTCSSRNALFDACVEHGCVAFLTSLIQSEDVLTQLVAVECISHFAGSEHGVNYFFEQELFGWVLHQSAEMARSASAASSANCTVDPMVSSACFSQVGEFIFTALSGSPELAAALRHHLVDATVTELMRILVAFLDETGEVERVAALSTLTALASVSAHTLHVVTANNGVVDRWLSLVQSGPEAQAAVLHSLATIALYHKDSSATISPTSTEEQDLYRVLELVGSRYRRGVDCTLAYLLKVAQQPIEPTHSAALELLTAIVQLRSGTGLPYVFSHENFYGYLLDRTTENSKEQMEAKHTLRLSVTQNPRYNLLSKEVTDALDRLVAEGAFARSSKAAMSDALTEEG